jgi:serine/threonine protein phosphatase PrpC
VADGHGSDSCPHSKSGSAIAVNVFCGLLSECVRRHADDFDALKAWLKFGGGMQLTRLIDAEWKRRVERSYRARAENVSAVAAQPTGRNGIWHSYGTTLLGAVIAPSFIFALQLGDGDILWLRGNAVESFIDADKLPGTETYSLSETDAWKRTRIKTFDLSPENTPYMLMLSTDGFSNSYSDDSVFHQTALSYFQAALEYGEAAIRDNLTAWLRETSALGSGDDITVVMALAPQQTKG